MNQVKKDPSHGYVLVKDGFDTFCPFQQPIPTQTPMGGMALMRLPCSTNCPLAKFSENRYTVCCGAEVKGYLIEGVIGEEKLIV